MASQYDHIASILEAISLALFKKLLLLALSLQKKKENL